MAITLPEGVSLYAWRETAEPSEPVVLDDETLVIYEPPCYPVLPEYDLVAGSVAEIR